MVRMVKVLEVNGPEGGFLAEVPGQQGRYVAAESLPELKTKLREVLDDPQSKFVQESWPAPSTGFTETAIFLSV